ncbi:MAG TPA: glycosyltransferase family 4 protein [Nitrospira sp.]|nr:glycosyltransferase family 4 protein [Nitrospira sp.]
MREVRSNPSVLPAVALILFNNSAIGGAERRYASVYQELRRVGVPVLFATNESLFQRLQEIGVLSCDDKPDFLLQEPLGRHARFLRKLDYLLGLLPLIWWIARRRPQVLHLVLGGAYLALPMLLAGLAPPTLLSVVCPNLREMVGSPLGVPLYRLALRRATRVEALTESVRQMVLSEGIPSERISVSRGSCVDTKRFQPGEKRPWVVFAGRLVPEKNPLLFVEACAIVRDRIGDRLSGLRMFLLGEGPLSIEIEALITRLDLARSIELGWSDHPEVVLSHSTVFVSLQRTDNYPSQALLEAMASGAAVVATNVGLTGKLVDEEVGRLVPAEAESVAGAILEWLENPGKAVLAGASARARVVQQYSTDSYVGHLRRLYSSVA